MTKYFLILLFCSVGPLNVDAQPTLARSLDLVAGINTFPIPAFEGGNSARGSKKPGVGYHFGITANLHDREGHWRFPFSVLYSSERGGIDGVERSSSFPSTFVTEGDVDIRERRLRFGVGANINVTDRVDIGFGVALSSLFTAEHQYTYRGATTALTDPATGQIVELPEPIPLAGTRLLYGTTATTYLSFPLSVGYLVAPRFRVSLEGDLGLRRLLNNGRSNYRISGTRLLVTGSYRLFSGNRTPREYIYPPPTGGQLPR